MLLLQLIGTIILLMGIIFIYDARPITKKMFSFGDQNEGAKGLKIVGFICTIIGGLLIITQV